MECPLDLLPIETYLEAMALRATCRLKRSGKWNDQTGYGNPSLKFVPHSVLCGGLTKEIPEMELPTDHQKQLLPPSLFKVKIKTRKDWEEGGSPRATRAIQCFTDGSKLDGKAGAAFYVPFYSGMRTERSFPWGSTQTFFKLRLWQFSKPPHT